MDIFQCEYPKFLMKDLKQCRKKESNSWLFEIVVNINNNIIKKSIEFLTVQIQGIIEQKPCDDIIILKDSTGKVKLINCDKVLCSKTTLTEGMYCAVTGILVREKGLPEVSGIKIIQIGEDDAEGKLLYDYWPIEVEDYQYFIAGIISPEIKTEDI